MNNVSFLKYAGLKRRRDALVFFLIKIYHAKEIYHGRKEEKCLLISILIYRICRIYNGLLQTVFLPLLSYRCAFCHVNVKKTNKTETIYLCSYKVQSISLETDFLVSLWHYYDRLHEWCKMWSDKITCFQETPNCNFWCRVLFSFFNVIPWYF